MQRFRALIIDDIKKSRDTLLHDIEEYCPEILVIGEAGGVDSGLELIQEKNPDVVFLDIQMGDGTGFDLLTRLDKIEFQIIFTTALDTYGIKAIKFSALDYLLKPVDPDDLMKAVAKLTPRKKDDNLHENIALLLENMRGGKPDSAKRLAVHTLERVHFVQVSDIMRLEASKHYTIFFLHNKEQVLSTRGIRDYEDLLEPHGFVRVHNSHVINVAYVKEFVKKDGGYAVLSDKSEIPVSFRRRNLLIDMMGGI